MIKTFTTSNGSTLKTGHVEVQPVASLGGTSTQPIVEAHVMISTPSKLSTVSAPSLSMIASRLSDDGFVMSTARGPGTGRVMPSFSLTRSPSVGMPFSSDDFAASTKKFEPYEELTGISSERPEVIMLTGFKPLYHLTTTTGTEEKRRYTVRRNPDALTPAGAFFECQGFMQALRQNNVQQLLTSLKQSYTSFKRITADRKNEFGDAMSELNITSHYLWNLMRALERLKQQFDLRDDIHTVDPQEVLRLHVIDYSPIRSADVLRHLTESVSSCVPSQYDIPAAMELFGYDVTNLRQVYTSTKIWLQLLVELKYVLSSHSLSMLDMDTSLQKADDSPVKVTKTTGIRRFEYAAYNPNVPSMNVLKDTTPGDVPATLNRLASAYNVIYANVHFKNDEARLAGLTNMISREYRYSRGLADESVQHVLKTYYGFNGAIGDNTGVFDAIIGQFGSNISDISGMASNALTTLSQQQLGNTVILPFESRYIEGANGTLTPGSTYYVESVLNTDGQKFDVSHLESLRDTFQLAHDKLNIIVNGLNLLSAEYVDDSHATSSTFDTILSNPRTLFNDIRSTFMSDDGVTTAPVQKDIFTLVLAAAHANIKVKSLLLMYLVTKISRVYATSVPSYSSSMTSDNTPTTELIIDLLLQELERLAPISSPSVVFEKSAKYTDDVRGTYLGADKRLESTMISTDMIRAALRSGGRLLTSVNDIMSKVFTTFMMDGKALTDGITRYGAHFDTVIMMTVLDVIVSIVGVYCDRHITGKHIDKSTTFFIVNERMTSHVDAINEVDNRLSREITLAQRAVFIVINTLNKLSSAISNVVNYVNGPNSLAQLHKIAQLFEDPKLLRLLFSGQQIRLFASSVADVSSALQGMSTNDGEFDADDEIAVLDDSVLSPKMKSAIESVLSLPEYASESSTGKKILTVGIPMGFAQHLRQKVDVKQIKQRSFEMRQDDVIKVCVRKVDLQNPDIIYGSQEFLFELSRFPVRNDSMIKNVAGSTLTDIVSKFPTRDYGQTFVAGGSEIQYYHAQKGEIDALASDDYSFLTVDMKRQLYINHIMSYLLEVYLRVMTGVTTADHHFDVVDTSQLIDTEFVKIVMNHHANYIATLNKTPAPEMGAQSAGTFFTTTMQKVTGGSMNVAGGPRRTLANSSGISGLSTTSALSQFSGADPSGASSEGESLKSTDAALSSLSTQNVSLALHTLGVIGEMSRMLTPQSNSLYVSRRMIAPKQFDRVFNVIIDPYDFKVDIDKTSATPYGKSALELMIKSGEIVPTSSPSAMFMGRRETSVVTHEFRPRDASQGDMTFEKYIVTIETLGEDTV